MNYAPYPQVGALGGVGLGALTYPSWFPAAKCVNCSASTTAHWESQTRFAKGLFDLWHNYSLDPNQKERAERYKSYLTPDIALHAESPFWNETLQRRSDHGAIILQGQRQSFHTSTSFTPGAAFESALEAVKKIPVVGDAVNITSEVYSAPFKIAINIASGARLDHVALAALKDHLKIAKDIAPYAQTVVSFVPGIGTGVSAAIGAGAALAEGMSITEAAKAGIRGALPGGPLAAAAFDTAMKVAAGENVAMSALESSRGLLPEGPARTAFDIGLAVATGEKIQTAFAKGLTNIAGAQLQTILAAGQKAVASTPGLADALKSVTSGPATQGFHLAAGLLAHTGISEKSIAAARSSLPPEMVQGFDAALKTQLPHLAWLAHVIPGGASASSAVKAAAPAQAPLRTMDPPKRPAAAPAPAPPRMLDPPKHAAAPAPTQAPLRTLDPPKRAPTQTLAPPQKTAAPASPSAGAVQPSAVAPGDFVYAPYPPHIAGALSGPPPDCLSLGLPITDMDGGMRQAGLSAVNGSRGRSRMVHGPDGKDYLFSLEGGALVARQCFSEAGLSAPPHPHGGHGGGHWHGERHFSHGGGNRGGWGGRGFPWNYVTTVQTCRTWGDPIMMVSEMTTAAQTALNASGGRPTTVRGPDGVLYLLAIENGTYTARPCVAVA